ncbi:hypothetical protein [Paracoccus sp. (in: a-proteobacteria)]|uniref:hypothetical protein n=1 Tax=Paracoccus sp. TaxID=267 RepID=UPI002AFEB512|nr:hypothetical protein [Paracoccus sp. (in: a-proteobacteria)]
MNGYTFSASEAEAARAVIALTSGDMDEDGYARFLAVNTAPEKRVNTADQIVWWHALRSRIIYRC